MPRFIGALTALIALVAGILAHLDPLVCLQRAAIVFTLGWVCGQVWHGLCGVSLKPSPEGGTATTEEPVT
jgi:membrane associated rhomboid family serine protease